MNRSSPALILGFLVILTSCSSHHLLSDHDLIMDYKWISPDHSRILIQYKYDQGALGYSRTWDSLVPASELDGNNMSIDLSQFHLPDQYDPVQWERDNSLTVKIDYVTWLRRGKDFRYSKDKDFLYGTRINVLIYDDTAGLEQKMETDIPAPNRKMRLVAYRYPNSTNHNSIHVSILKSGEAIPRYGNFYIASGGGDVLLKGEWKNDHEIVFYTNSTGEPYLVCGSNGHEDCEGFVKNSFGIKYQIVIDGRIPGYLWMKD
jgi:hypothetical protein